MAEPRAPASYAAAAPARRAGPARLSRGAVVWWAVLILQVVCAGFFLWDVLGPRLGLRTQPVDWRLHELIEILAVLGLISGVVLGAATVARARRRTQEVEAQLDRASAAFADVVEDRFTAWALTPAERDVAWFALKGFTTAEIAGFRQTSESTVKAQTNAIYRKAGVGGRAQLVSLFVEDLLARAPSPPAT